MGTDGYQTDRDDHSVCNVKSFSIPETQHCISYMSIVSDFPRGPVDGNPTASAWDTDPWSGKIPYAMEQLSY